MPARVRVNGVAVDTVSALDRGLAYGDGLFESIRLLGGAAPLWSRHMRRLEDSCRRLQLPMPDTAQLWRESVEVGRGLADCVIRITLTRGCGPRGYAPPAVAQPTRVVAAFDAPQLDADVHASGVALRVCDMRLAAQPRLAGMKHLNRLEQVLARAEWNDPAIGEGVLCDTRGRVISSTMANLFAVLKGQLWTPALDDCGVAGVARDEVLATVPDTRIGDLSLDALLDASEVFLTSSVRGIVPVRSLGARAWPVGPFTRRLQHHWNTLGLTMEQGG
jgi:4-amino-4-deoxychorismate lyase